MVLLHWQWWAMWPQRLRWSQNTYWPLHQLHQLWLCLLSLITTSDWFNHFQPTTSISLSLLVQPRLWTAPWRAADHNEAKKTKWFQFFFGSCSESLRKRPAWENLVSWLWSVEVGPSSCGYGFLNLLKLRVKEFKCDHIQFKGKDVTTYFSPTLVFKYLN